MNAAPASLIEAARQFQLTKAVDLMVEAKRIIELPLLAPDEGITFTVGEPAWENALRVCILAYAHSPLRNDSQITLRPYPGKRDGAWRVEAFSAEYYVDETHVFRRWVGEPCACYCCKGGR
jgi:hypothetical protein